MADGSTRPIGAPPVGSRARRLSPGLLTVGIGSVFAAGIVTTLTGFGAPGAVQQIGAARDVEVITSSGQPGQATAGTGLVAGDIVTTGARGTATLDAGTSRLYIGAGSSVLVDSATHWTVRTGQVGLSRAPLIEGPEPAVTAGAFTVVAGPGSGVRIDRAGSVQAAVLRGSAQVLAGTASLHLATLRQLSLPGTTLTVPQLVQTLDDSADSVDAQLAPQLVALDSALTRLATQVGADPLAGRLFGHDGLPPSEAALEWAIQQVGNGTQLVAAGPGGHVAWGILAAAAGADDTQVRAYVGTVLDGTAAAPVGPPDAGTAGQPSSPPVVVGATAGPVAGTSPAGPTSGGDGPSAASPSRDTADTGSSPPPTAAAPTTPPVESPSPADSTPPPDQSSPPAPSTAPPTSAAVPSDQPSSAAPTTDPAAQQQQSTSGGSDPQSAPAAAATAGPFGLLAVLARGVAGPATKPSASAAVPVTKPPAPLPSPASSPAPSRRLTPRVLTTKTSAVHPAVPKTSRSVKSKPVPSGASPPLALRSVRSRDRGASAASRTTADPSARVR